MSTPNYHSYLYSSKEGLKPDPLSLLLDSFNFRMEEMNQWCNSKGTLINRYQERIEEFTNQDRNYRISQILLKDLDQVGNFMVSADNYVTALERLVYRADKIIRELKLDRAMLIECQESRLDRDSTKLKGSIQTTPLETISKRDISEVIEDHKREIESLQKFLKKDPRLRKHPNQSHA